MAFPTTIDAPPDAATLAAKRLDGTDLATGMTSVGPPHTEDQDDLGQMIVAVETKVGIDGSADAASHDFKIAALEAVAAALGTASNADTTDFDAAGAAAAAQAFAIARANHTGSQTLSTISDAGTAASKDTGTSAGQVPVLDGAGKLAAAIIPVVAISETFVVVSQAAMLALTAQTGDVAIRTDISENFILGGGGDPTNLADWIQLVHPSDAVTSVAGRTGAVTLSTADIGGLGNVATRNVGTTAGTAAAGDDSRFTDARAPSGAAGGDLAGTYPNPTLGTSGVTAATKGSASKTVTQTVDAKGRLTALTDQDIAIVPSQVAGTAVVTADSRLADARTPTTHAASHATGGTDVVTLTESQITGLVADLAAKIADALLTTRGDVIYRNASNVTARLGLGAAGRPLGSNGTDLAYIVAPGPMFGDGSDGAVTISGTTTLTKDMHYSTLTVQSGGILNTGGYRIFANTKIDVQSGGTLRNNGNNGANGATGASAGGAAAASGSLRSGGAGGNGGVAAGTAGSSVATNGLGGNAGAGGAGGVSAGAAGGTATVPTAPNGSWRTYPTSTTTLLFNASASGAVAAIGPGAGGGGAGGDGTDAGGGGGGAGGMVVLAAPVINIDGTIQALGGNGGNGNGTFVLGCGGGGGGGGGVIYFTYNALSGAVTPSAAVMCAGGSGGSKSGTGVAGVGGAAGVVIQVTNG